MADFSMKDFLLQHYMQLRFNNMPAEVRAKYTDFLNGNDGKGDFRGNMADWKKNLMHEEGRGNWVENQLPDPTDSSGPFYLNDDEWKKLFKAFQSAFRAMGADKDNFKDNKKANDFLDEYFGDASKLFSYATADHEAEAQIQNLQQAFNNYPQLEQALKQSNIVSSDFSLRDFTSKLNSKNYNSDPKFQEQLLNIVRGLEWLAQENPNVATMLQKVKFDKIQNGFESTIDPNKLAYFKRMYRPLLNTLGQESKVFTVFKNYDSGKISGPIEEAKKKVGYDDKQSDDYVPPKRKDELTAWQQLKERAGDTYNDVLGKYLSAHGNRVYFSPSARFIVNAIDGAKIKPTDGIDKILESESKIKSNLQYKSPTATKHFEWFIKTIKELKDTMPKAYAGALKHGRQMKAIIAEMIKKAVREGKIDEAKSAMEVLSVIKYGYTTSKTMTAIGKEKFSIFSDSKLSWNKNEGMQFITNAMDKSLKFAFMTVGYGITMAGNAYRLNGSKFNKKRGRLADAQTQWANKNSADRQRIQDEFDNSRRDRDLHQQTLDNLNTSYGINDTTINTKRNDLAIARQGEIPLKHDIQRKEQRLQATNNRINNEARNVSTKRSEIYGIITELRDIKNQIRQQDAILANPDPTGTLPPASVQAIAQTAAQRKADLTKIQNKKRQELRNQRKQLHRIPHKAADARRQLGTYQRELDDARRNLTQMQNNNFAQERRLNAWGDAKDMISMLDKQISEHDKTLREWDDKHKDHYMELMAYWDMLETGRDSHTGAMYKWALLRSNKHSQENFDKNKAAFINNYLSKYSYAA